MTTETTDESGDRILRQTLQGIVAGRFGDSSFIKRVERNRYEYIASYECDLITMHLSTGEQFRFFLKDYGFSHKTKDDPDRRREREMRVYRDLLSRTQLGAPEYYGSIWDISEGRFWIFLEFVDGVIIRDHDAGYDLLAAEWLGKMQGYFAQRQGILNSSDFLIRQNTGFFRSKAELALGNVAQISPLSATRLTKVLKGYQRILGEIETQPRTLVHGGYIPWHILLDIECEPTRVCAVDWESAANGPTLYDIAYYTHGMDLQSRAVVLDAYRRAAIRHGVSVPARAQMDYIVDCLGLHRIFDWLSRAVEKRFTQDKVAWLLDEAEQLSLRVFG